MYVPGYHLSRLARALVVAIAFAASMVRDCFAFAVSMFGGLARPAPTVVSLAESVKLSASEARGLSMAKRERPVIFAGWRMSPST